MTSLIFPALLLWSDPIAWANPSSQETIFLVMRHGETYGNQATDPTTYTYTGCQTDFFLNEKGVAQAEAVAKKIRALYDQKKLPISAIYTSPLSRATQTATPIGTALKLPLQTRSDLREIDWGEADGKLVKEIDDKWDEEEEKIEKQSLARIKKWDLLPVFPNAEKFNQVLNRTTLELKKIAEQHRGQVVLIVTHGRVLKCLTAAVLNQDDNAIPYPKNAGVAVFRDVKDLPLQFIELRE